MTEVTKPKKPRQMMIPVSMATQAEISALSSKTGIKVSKIREILAETFNSEITGRVSELVQAKVFGPPTGTPPQGPARPMGT